MYKSNLWVIDTQLWRHRTDPRAPLVPGREYPELHSLILSGKGVDVQEYLDALGITARRFLQTNLPQLGPDWWEKGVVSALSYQQRQIAV